MLTPIWKKAEFSIGGQRDDLKLSVWEDFRPMWYLVGAQLKDVIMMVRWEGRTLIRSRLRTVCKDGMKC